MFGKRVVVGRQLQTGDAIDRTRKTPRASRTSPGVGRVASEVADPTEMAAIWAAYKKNGGTLSFQQIELDPRFKLRKANGNTAFRIIKRVNDSKKTTGAKA